jgi:hypothetical protein
MYRLALVFRVSVRKGDISRYMHAQENIMACYKRHKK